MLVTRHGITRRLQALQAIGWSKNQISRATGLYPPTIQRIMNDDESPIGSRTAASIIAGYKRLSDVPPPQHTVEQMRMVMTVRTAASERGYVPPSAWENIDEDLRPRWARPSLMGRPEPLSDVLMLLRAGVPPELVAQRSGVLPTSLARRLRRNGHHLWAAACERKPVR